MPELSQIRVNETGDMFQAVPMPPFRDSIYVMSGYGEDGEFKWRKFIEEDEWLD